MLIFKNMNRNNQIMKKKIGKRKGYFTLILIYFQTIMITDALQDMIKTMNLHHVTVVTNYRKCEDYYLDHIYQKIVQQIPTITVDFLDISQSGDNRTLEMTTFKNPRQSTIYVILQGKNTYRSQFMDVKDILHQLVQVAPVKMRPRCLVVFSNHGNFSQDKAEQILLYAWSLKFLDLTVLIVDSQQSNYISYNPFTKTYDIGSLKNENYLFPNKLIDVNKYVLNIPVLDFPPYLIVKTNDKNEIYIDGSNSYLYFKSVAEKLNFKLNYTYFPGQVGEAYFNAVFSIGRDETNMSPITIIFKDQIIELDILLGDVFEIAELVVIVPIIPQYNVDIPFAAFIYLSSFIIIIIICFVSLRVLKIKSKQWNFLYLFAVLIGMGTSRPKKLSERIIFITMAILSIIYTNELFSKLAEIKIVRSEKDFNTFEEIENSQLNVYSPVPEKYFDNEEFQKLTSKGQLMQNFTYCLNELIYTRNAICIVPLGNAIYFVNKHLDAEGNPIIKMADMSSNREFAGFTFGRASLFIEQFNKLIQRMIECAVFPDREMYKVELHDSKEKSTVTDDTIIKTALSILIIGFSTATVAYIQELNYYSIISVILKKNIRAMSHLASRSCNKVLKKFFRRKSKN